MVAMAATQSAGIVQFLFDLQVDAKTSRANIKTLVGALEDADKKVEAYLEKKAQQPGRKAWLLWRMMAG